METVNIEILNPKVRKILKNLAKLNLIKINKKVTDVDTKIDKDTFLADLKMSLEQVKEGKTKPLNTLWNE
jgi:hypothetical protein